MIRSMYVQGTDPEVWLSAGRLLPEIRSELRRFPAEAAGPAGIDQLQCLAAAWASEEAGRYRALLDGADSTTRSVLVRRAALGCAPLALMSGAWLQWLTAPGHAEDPVALKGLALYAADVGVGHPRASRGDAYLELLRHLHLSENAVPAARLTRDQRIDDGAFYLPGVLLTMSRRPDDFLAEILGADLCLRTVGLLPALTVVKELLPTVADWPGIDPATARQPAGLAGSEQCRRTIEALLSRADAGARRQVMLGFQWALNALRHWSDGLRTELDASRDPAYEMAELLRLRGREGAVYHRGLSLGGRSLSEWLRDSSAHPGPLLEVLAGSRLVKPGRAAASPLVNGLISERGPMFRVFAPEDLTVLARWIDSLPATGQPAADPTADGASQVTAVASAMYEMSPLLLADTDAGSTAPGRAPADLREAYHLLQTRTGTPALHRYALAYVDRWLARSGHGIDRDRQGLPTHWKPEGLQPWLAEQHDQHGHEFEESSASPGPSRQELITSTIQLAPLTLIDGAWLQGFTNYEHASSEIGFFLFETYWDELGNGEPQLNHPLIYREVLAEMGVDLPPTGSMEFARWPGFHDNSFELPVYWLCIGRFPQTFLPELLGLNLAMELSGVGGSYRQARIALKTYGFSTRFVDIHNTIDNIASGHSAWAADAVDTYLATLPASQGSGARAEVWKRIRVGYRSLNPPDSLGARRAARRARTMKERDHA